MDLGLSFTFVFDDEEWVKKLLIGTVAYLIVLIGWIPLLGWAIEVSRRVIRDDPTPLPDWDDLGGYFILGLKGLVIFFIAALLPIVLAFPFILLAAFDSNAEGLFVAYSVCYGCFSILYGIFLAFALPASFGVLADTDQLSDALNPGKLLALIRAVPATYVLTLIGSLLASFVGSLGSIVCGIGLAFTMAYSAAITGHLYGQAYKQASEALSVE